MGTRMCDENNIAIGPISERHSAVGGGRGEMSLVDYASSDEEEEEIDLHGIEEAKGKKQIESAVPSLASPPLPPLPPSSVLPPNRRNQ
ncbi:hypothetical protein BHM03_00054396 [Ensete ventricosum]|nr:hypothetical protein BHM03_00054396 [Ensete ventricosum]